MQFFSFFKTLIDQVVVVELKNEIKLKGRLHSVDQYLNIKLTGVEVVDGEKYPHLAAVTSCFVRGSVVRYVQLPVTVDVQLLQDACRRSFRNTSEEDKPATAAA